MSELDLDAIQARLDAATPGPWKRRDQSRMFEPREWYVDTAASGIEQPYVASIDEEVDAELIAHAPTDIASLLAALREARQENERLRMAVDNAQEVALDV